MHTQQTYTPPAPVESSNPSRDASAMRDPRYARSMRVRDDDERASRR